MRFGRLTVLRREGSNEKGRVTWLCQCDCGNTTICTGDNLQRGNTTSCGCYSEETKHTRKAPKEGESSLESEYPEFVKNEWNYDLNQYRVRPNPSDYKSMSKSLVWWICPKCGKFYQYRVQDQIRKWKNNIHSCNSCNEYQGTSFEEQAILYYMKQIYPSAVSRDTSAIGMELDIYIPEIKTAIEYNGHYFHKELNDMSEKDALKREKAKENNIRLITFNEIKTNEEPTYEGDSIHLKIVKHDYNYFSKAVNLLFEMLNINKTVNVVDDMMKIRAQYDNFVKDHSIAKIRPDLVSHYSLKDNEGISPENVLYISNKPVMWICDVCGKSYPDTPNRVTMKNKGTKFLCDKCKWIRKQVNEEYQNRVRIKTRTVKSNVEEKEIDGVIYRKCVKCGEYYPKTDYPVYKSHVSRKCRKCTNEYKRQKRVENKNLT